ncbi:MAG: hypothetical protein KKA07_04235, partial [Bacteroidetes bacterium]|nr:hypothetical protein [Bacteroidota bacterium]
MKRVYFSGLGGGSRCVVLSAFFVFFSQSAFPQGIYNNGACITVQSSANIKIDGDANGNYVNSTNAGFHGSIDLDGVINLEGDWTNNAASGNVLINIEGAPAARTGEVVMNGTTQQEINGSASTYFEMLTINNSAAEDAVLLSGGVNQYVNGVLTFTDGILSTGSNVVIVENDDPAAVTGYAAPATVISDRFCNGNLKRRIRADASDFAFPMGTVTAGTDYYEYTALTVNAVTSGSTPYLSATFNRSAITPPGAVPGGLQVNGTDVSEWLDYGYWTFTPENLTTIDYDITAVSQGHSNGAGTAEQHSAFRRVTGTWDNDGTHDNATQSGTLTNPITAVRTGITSTEFTDFIIGRSADLALDVGLLSFQAICENNGVELIWVVSDEINMLEYMVEESNDGLQWEVSSVLPAYGFSAAPRTYSVFDPTASDLYRLVAIEFSGKTTIFDPIATDCFNPPGEPVVSYNPADNSISFLLAEDARIEYSLYNAAGQLVVSDCLHKSA